MAKSPDRWRQFGDSLRVDLFFFNRLYLTVHGGFSLTIDTSRSGTHSFKMRGSYSSGWWGLLFFKTRAGFLGGLESEHDRLHPEIYYYYSIHISAMNRE